MAILSVDLAYKRYADIGVVVLQDAHGIVECSLHPLPLVGPPSPDVLADYLDNLCQQLRIRIILMDGPQGWKAPDNGLLHSRRCERELNTPAKTGEPFSVKPRNYTPFVVFSIAVYNALAALGWNRLLRLAPEPPNRLLIESFPLSAWHSLHVDPLPSKAKARAQDVVSRLAALGELFPIHLSQTPTHDQLQALVSGFAGLAIERNEWDTCAAAGCAPVFEQQHWREGFILNPVRPA